MTNPRSSCGILSRVLLLASVGLYAPRVLAEDPKPYVFRRAVVLCIGIDKYRFINEVKFAEHDAKSFGESLRERYGFTPSYLLGPQATKDAILDTIRSYATPRLDNGAPNPEFLGEHDVLVIYFAGHGQVIPVPIDLGKPSGREGFLVPYEARLPADLKDFRNPEQWEREAIDMRELVRLAEGMKAQHVLVIVDACCSGFMTQRGSYLSARYDLQLLLTGRSRAVLAATTDRQGATWDEKLGHGYFTAALLDELKSWSDRGEASSLTDVFDNVRFQVSSATRGNMVPQMNPRAGEGDGEFVFLPKTLRSNDVEHALRQASALRDKTDPGLSRGHILAKVLERSRAREKLKTTVRDVIAAYDASDYRYSTDSAAMDQLWRGRFERYYNAAAAGDVLAMTALHFCYSKGLGTEKSPAAAYRWAVEAYDSGQPAGQYVLGRCLSRGIGAVKNQQAGRRLTQESADKGFPLGELTLALSLLENQPSRESARKAISLLEKAGQAGSTSARTVLGQLYCGLVPTTGLRVDMTVGRGFLDVAAGEGNRDAMFVLYQLEKAADGERARTWLVRAGENGQPQAQALLAMAHYQHPNLDGEKARKIGLPRDVEKARRYAELASAQNQPMADLLLAIMYESGDGVVPNEDLARKYCDKAAAANFAPAVRQQGHWYRNGRVYPRDEARGVQLMDRADRIERSGTP